MLDDFLSYQAKTTPHPLGLAIKRAKGSYIVDQNGKKYLDFIAGVSACSLGHRHPAVVRAMKRQINRYMHVMVYGEYVQSPAVELCKLLAQHLPSSLEVTYLTNSGTEAIEGAMKLAKRVTGKGGFIAAKNAYHGSTQGALSLLGVEKQKEGYGPLLPEVEFISFNALEELEKITTETAGVVLETIQGGGGFILPAADYLLAVKKRCEEVGALLILDEIQPGIGRTGKLFAFEHYGVTPDILVIGKGLGGGMPIGAFCSSAQNMEQLTHSPSLGHITTFGGNPVIAAAGLATLKTIINKKIMAEIDAKEALFRELLVHPKIKQINGRGLMLAPILENPEQVSKVVFSCMEKGLILFFLLWEKKGIRLSPPLNISKREIQKGCKILLEALEEL
ncbi:aminotransferase class III-fold pyridoxal phosphate-dependent enzyme [Flavobacteriaceae bacterium]|nr:aminotransferase class III-fold pyridoxal phosphate-dependent enzyme [Flavobacteriaceae bacterium]